MKAYQKILFILVGLSVMVFPATHAVSANVPAPVINVSEVGWTANDVLISVTEVNNDMPFINLGGSVPGVAGNGYVEASVSDSLGNIYIAGTFSAVGNVPTAGIAMWDGFQWSSLGTGLIGSVYSLAIGPDDTLYAGGNFSQAGDVVTHGIAKWDGFEWSAIGNGLDVTASVNAVAVDGSGDLIIGGYIPWIDGVETYNIAKWNGVTWENLGDGLNNRVYTLSVYADGSIVAGGQFSGSGSTPLSFLAQWDGISWTEIGGGVDSVVYATAVGVDGYLLVGGAFLNAGGFPAQRFAVWDGVSWDTYGTGFNSTVYAFEVFDDGTFYVAGGFGQVDGATVSGIVYWNGTDWAPLGDGVVTLAVGVRTVISDSNGGLFVGGAIKFAGGIPVINLAYWDGLAWESIGSGIDANVYKLAIDGSGNLYAAGNFNRIGNIFADMFAYWDGSWHSVETGLTSPNYINTIATDQNGHIIVGGQFPSIGGVAANNIAIWDGTNWTGIGGGLSSSIQAIHVSTEGVIYVAYGSSSDSTVAKWDGANWIDLGDSFDAAVRSIAVLPDGTLYVGGDFRFSGSNLIRYVAFWNGTSWSVLGSGVNLPVTSLVLDASGNLYAGGRISSAGGQTALGVAKWDGVQWYDVGFDYATNVYSLTIMDGVLYAGGSLGLSSSTTPSYLAYLDGDVWRPVGVDLNGFVNSFAVSVDSKMYGSGAFITSGDASTVVNKVFLIDGLNYSYEYSTDGLEWTAGSSVLVSTESENCYFFRATDGLSNYSDTSGPECAFIDKTPPVVTPDAAALAAWAGSSYSLVVEAADPLSGVSQVYCKRGDESAYTLGVGETCSRDFSANGTMYFYAVDNVGNQSAEQSVVISNFDTTSPSVTFVDGPAPDSCISDASDLSYSWTSFDAESGFDYYHVYYGPSQNGTSSIENSSGSYVAPIDLESGIYYLRVEAVDAVGNSSGWLDLASSCLNADPSSQVVLGKSFSFSHETTLENGLTFGMEGTPQGQTNPLIVNVAPSASPPAPTSGHVLVGQVVRLTAEDLITSQPATTSDDMFTVSFSYSEETANGLNEDQLEINFYDETNSVWVPVASDVDKVNNTVSGTTNVFADFTLMDTLPSVQFESAQAEDVEGTSISAWVVLESTSTIPVTVDWFASGGTATLDDDYFPISGSITFDPGSQREEIVIDLIDDQLFDESLETFFITLTSPSNAVLGDSTTMSVSIQNKAQAVFEVFIPMIVR